MKKERVITLQNFENYLPARIVERGRDYFEQGLVSDLTLQNKGDWTATVEGGGSYRVQILLKENVVWFTSCNCPHDVEYCKHIVAGLYELRAHIDEQKPLSKRASFSETVDQLQPEKLRQFIKEYAKGNPEFRGIFQAHFAPPDDTAAIRNMYGKLITNAAEKAARGETYLDWQAGPIFAKDVEKLLGQARADMQQQRYAQAVEIAFAVIENVHEYLATAHSGAITDCIDHGFELLWELTGQDLPKDLRQQIFQHALNEAADPKYEPFYYYKSWLGLAVALADDRQKQNRCLILIDQLLNIAQKKASPVAEHTDVAPLLKQKLILLRKSGQEKEAEQLSRLNLRVPLVRMDYIEELLARKQYAEARQQTLEGLDKDRGNIWAGKEYRLLLLKIAEEGQDIAAYRQSARDLYDKGKDFDYYKLIKATYSPTEWPQVAEDFIHELQTMRFVDADEVKGYLAQIYAEEKYWPRLLELLQNTTSLPLVDHFIKYIARDYPREALEIYKVTLMDYAMSYKAHNHSLKIRDRLIKIKAWPGGPEVVRELIAHFNSRWNQRKSLLDLLKDILD